MIDADRVILRPITDEDTPLIVKWRNQDDVRKNFFFRATFTEEMHRQWMSEKVRTGQVQQFIILLDDIPVGCTYLRDIDFDNKSAEYGVFIGEAYARGQGVGSIALNRTLEYAYATTGINLYKARVMADNIPSYKTFINNGFIVTERVPSVTCSDAEEKEMILLEKHL